MKGTTLVGFSAPTAINKLSDEPEREDRAPPVIRGIVPSFVFNESINKVFEKIKQNETKIAKYCRQIEELATRDSSTEDSKKIRKTHKELNDKLAEAYTKAKKLSKKLVEYQTHRQADCDFRNARQATASSSSSSNKILDEPESSKKNKPIPEEF